MSWADISLADVAAVLLALIALGRALWTRPQERQESDATTSNTYAQAAKVTAEQVIAMQRQLDCLEAEVKALERRLAVRENLIQRWQVGIGILIDQLGENKIEPRWRPIGAEEVGK